MLNLSMVNSRKHVNHIKKQIFFYLSLMNLYLSKMNQDLSQSVYFLQLESYYIVIFCGFQYVISQYVLVVSILHVLFALCWLHHI